MNHKNSEVYIHLPLSKLGLNIREAQIKKDIEWYDTTLVKICICA